MTDQGEIEPGVETEETPSAPEPELIGGHPVTETRGQRVIHPPLDGYLKAVKALRADGFIMCVDLTAVDYQSHPGRTDLPAGVAQERFELVVNLIDHRSRERIRLRVQVPENEPIVPSIFELHPGTEAMEREVFDMFGITFEGHPDLTRILMPEDWVGHPLRKDYASGRIPVQFKATGSR